MLIVLLRSVGVSVLHSLLGTQTDGDSSSNCVSPEHRSEELFRDISGSIESQSNSLICFNIKNYSSESL